MKPKIYIQHSGNFYEYTGPCDITKSYPSIKCMSNCDIVKDPDFPINSYVYFEDKGWAVVRKETQPCGRCIFEGDGRHCRDVICRNRVFVELKDNMSEIDYIEDEEESKDYYVINIVNSTLVTENKSKESAIKVAETFSIENPGVRFGIVKVIAECTVETKVIWMEKE